MERFSFPEALGFREGDLRELIDSGLLISDERRD
jgi:hypothetical protein